MKMKKICLTMVMALVLIFFIVIPVQAKKNMQLADQAGLLSDQERQKIDDQLAELEERTGWDLMALTTDDASGMDATAYAEVWFDENTTGDDGVICAIDMDNREIVVRAFGEAMNYITDERTDNILDAGYEEVSNEAYFATLREMFREVEYIYQQEAPSRNHLYDENTGEITRYFNGGKITLLEILIALGLAILAGGVFVRVIFSKYRLKTGGYKYPRKNGNINVTVREDNLVDSFVTTRHIQKPPRNSARGGPGPGPGGPRAGGGRPGPGPGGSRAGGGSRPAPGGPVRGGGSRPAPGSSSGRTSSGGSRSIPSGGSRAGSSGGSRSIPSGGSRTGSSGGSRRIPSGGSRTGSSGGSRRGSSGGSKRF